MIQSKDDEINDLSSIDALLSLCLYLEMHCGSLASGQVASLWPSGQHVILVTQQCGSPSPFARINVSIARRCRL